MVAALVISIMTFIGVTMSILVFPHFYIRKIRIDTYWIIALLGAVLLLCIGLAPIKEVWLELTSDKAINPLKILVLFFSMTLLSILLDEFGLFKYLASVTSRHAKGNQYLLFFLLYLLTSLLTIFTSNDVVILTLTPFIVFFCKNSKINPIPYLISEFAAANTWSTMFIIGNPTNIYLATSAGINFLDYFKVMGVPTLLMGLTELLIIFLLFNNKLKDPISINNDEYHINSKVDLFIGLSIFIICLIFLVISSYIHIEMWLVSLICASTLLLITIVIRLITKKNWDYVITPIKRLPYQLIPFFLSMFVIVVALNTQGITSKIAEYLGNSNTVWIYGYSSLLTSNLINNIPMSILYTSLSSNLTGVNYIRAIYSSIIGSNIGAYLTPIGALAGIMFSSLLNKYEIKFSFLTFIKYGVIIAIPTITVGLGSLLLFI